MKKEKIILAVLSLVMIAGSILSLNLLIEHIQGQEVVERIDAAETKEGKGSSEDSEKAGITEKPFQVLVSGVDMTGSLKQNKRYRSDSNLLLSVNPVDKKILITNIPRDTYVKPVDVPEFSEKEAQNMRSEGFTEDLIKEAKEAREAGLKTKLCHVSLYGMPSLVKTVEGLLDTKIDYHIRLTMTGFKTLVDSVGGVDVEAVESFKTDGGTSYQKGINHVNGKEALAFVRERHHFNDGELRRGINNVEMMRAIIHKLCDASLLDMDAGGLYQLWKNNVETDMGMGEVLSLLRMQVEDRAEWKITSAIVKGEGSREKTLEYPQTGFWVLIPDAASVKEAQEKIADVCKVDQ